MSTKVFKVAARRQAVGYVMTEHPAWRAVGPSTVRAFPTDTGLLGTTRLHNGPNGTSRRMRIDSSGEVEAHEFVLTGPIQRVPELWAELRAFGPVLRFPNTSLWDALATAIVRQVIRASQSRQLYRTFSDRFGRTAEVAGSVIHLFPDAERILTLTDGQFARVGLAFKARNLRASAEAYLTHRTTWKMLPPDDLIDALQGTKGIGEWTARAAVADWTNDFSCYPYGDLAVRKWATHAAPSFAWPGSDREFASVWTEIAGSQLSALTLLTLARGSQFGAIG